MRRDPRIAVTVCVGYGDFLKETASVNSHLLDDWIIVTTEADEETREVCRRHNLTVVLSEDYKRSAGGYGGGTFNKGAMINRGLALMPMDCTRIHLDSDIVLPKQFNDLLDMSDIQPHKIYGCDRMMFRTWEAWQEGKRLGWLNHSHTSIHMPTGVTMGNRWASKMHGYVPIGFFQLWHSSADEWRGQKQRVYESNHGGAHRTDVMFGLLWDRRDRIHLPELIVAHLESEECETGKNWNGRCTRRFGPHCHKPPPRPCS